MLLDNPTMSPVSMLPLQLFIYFKHFQLTSNLGLLSLPSPRLLTAQDLAYQSEGDVFILSLFSFKYNRGAIHFPSALNTALFHLLRNAILLLSSFFSCTGNSSRSQL